MSVEDRGELEVDKIVDLPMTLLSRAFLDQLQRKRLWSFPFLRDCGRAEMA